LVTSLRIYLPSHMMPAYAADSALGVKPVTQSAGPPNATRYRGAARSVWIDPCGLVAPLPLTTC
jgi:hypothetical protein